MFKNLKIGVRLGVGFAITLALLVAVAVTGVARIGQLSDNLDELVNDNYPKTVLANSVVRAINVIARNLRNAVIYSDVERQKSLEAIPAQRKVISDAYHEVGETLREMVGKRLDPDAVAFKLTMLVSTLAGPLPVQGDGQAIPEGLRGPGLRERFLDLLLEHLHR